MYIYICHICHSTCPSIHDLCISPWLLYQRSLVPIGCISPATRGSWIIPSTIRSWRSVCYWNHGYRNWNCVSFPIHSMVMFQFATSFSHDQRVRTMVRLPKSPNDPKWLVVWNMNLVFSIQLEMSSSQLTFTHFLRGVGLKPPSPLPRSWSATSCSLASQSCPQRAPSCRCSRLAPGETCATCATWRGPGGRRVRRRQVNKGVWSYKDEMKMGAVPTCSVKIILQIEFLSETSKINRIVLKCRQVMLVYEVHELSIYTINIHQA